MNNLTSFLTDPINAEGQELLRYLSVIPANGELPSAHDRAAQNQAVVVVVNAKKEINIKEAAVLKCQIIEPSVGGVEGSIIANIPIKVSVRALLSKFV